MTNPVHDERGETLIELMITILVLSIGMVTLVGAVGSSILASSTHRGIAQGDVIVRDFAEAVKEKAAENVDDPGTPATNEYFPCPGEALLDPGADFEAPGGWNAPEITGVEWWTPDTGNEGWSSSNVDCLARYSSCGEINESCDPGLERVTFTVSNQSTGTAATSLTASVVVRRPNPVPTP